MTPLIKTTQSEKVAKMNDDQLNYEFQERSGHQMSDGASVQDADKLAYLLIFGRGAE